jgi:hypothetical protein
MSEARVLLDPTSERKLAIRERLPRAKPDDLTVALLDISKPRGNLFLGRIEERFKERGIQTKRYSKPTFTKPAPLELRQQIALDCGAVVEALAD